MSRSILNRNFIRFVDFYNNPNSFVIDETFHKMSAKRIFFSIGRDKKFRPVIYIYPSRIDPNELNDFERFVKIYLGIIQKYCLKPYYIENWVIVIDLEHKGLLNFPFKAIRAAVDATNVDFASRLHKMFLVNPSFIFNTTWNIAKGLLDIETVMKISFVKKKDLGIIQEHINQDQLLKEYGGKLETPKAAYPVLNTLEYEAVPEQSPEDNLVNNIIMENDYKDLLKQTKRFYCHSSDELFDNHNKFAVETRSIRFVNDKSDFHKEMTVILGNSNGNKSLSYK